MDSDPIRTRFDEALAEARIMVAQLSNSTGSINGYPTSPGDVAALIIATAISRRSGAVKGAVWRQTGNAAGIMERLSALTGSRANGTINDRHLLRWSISRCHLHLAGDVYRMTAVSPGLHLSLPRAETDHEALLGEYRAQMLRIGVPAIIASGASASTTDAGYGSWTRFTVPMPDARLTTRLEIMDAQHLSTPALRESLKDYARQTLDAYVNGDSLSRLADLAQADAEGKAAGVDGLGVGEVRLHSIGGHTTAQYREHVTLHVPVTTINEAMSPISRYAVYSSELGLRTLTGHTMDTVVDDHVARTRLLLKHGGVRADATGMALLASQGHDVDAMIADIRKLEVHYNKPKGTTYLYADKGCITAVTRLSDEVRWHRDHLDIPGELPATLMEGLVGRQATAVVEHPALAGAVISRVRRKGHRTHIHLEPRWETRP